MRLQIEQRIFLAQYPEREDERANSDGRGRIANTMANSARDSGRAVREMQNDMDKRIDAIRTELKEKRPEAGEAIERSLGDLRTSFEERLSEISEGFDNAREGLDSAVETGRATIKDRPLMSVGVAVAAGVIIGLIFGRRIGKKD